VEKRRGLDWGRRVGYMTAYADFINSKAFAHKREETWGHGPETDEDRKRGGGQRLEKS